MTRDELYSALCAELTNRSVEYRAADVFGFVAACWPTDATAEQLADDWQGQQDEPEVGVMGDE